MSVVLPSGGPDPGPPGPDIYYFNKEVKENDL